VCDCHAFIKGNLLTYLLTYLLILSFVAKTCLARTVID